MALAFLRIVLVSILAAVAACAVTSMLLFGNIESASFFPLIFALPSSLLLLATTYAALAEKGRPILWRYAVLILVGVIGGGLMLGFISNGDPKSAATGSLYGVTTALCWILLHALTRWGVRAPIDAFTA